LPKQCRAFYVKMNSLQTLLQLLQQTGELHEIKVPVSPYLELSAIVRRVSKLPASPALLFSNLPPFDLPAAANLFGSEKRLCHALGISNLTSLTAKLKKLLSALPENASLPELSTFLSEKAAYAPRLIPRKQAACYAEELAVDLLKLPFHQNWPDDGSTAGTGRYITLGQVVTSLPDGNDCNYGIYRCQIHNADTLAIRWRQGSGAWQHFQQYKQQGQKMPLAIVLGGPPALTLASAWPLPTGVNELAFAGWLQGAAISVTNCSHALLSVPAEAEIVLEGFAEPDEQLMEGPFGNHTGFYDSAGWAAKVRITRIFKRKNAVLPLTLVGPPPQEDCWMMLGWERILAAFLPKLVPGVLEISTPIPWVFRQSAVISVDRQAAKNLHKLVKALWDLPWFSSARLLVFVDKAVRPDQILQVAWRMVNETDWQTGLIRDESGKRLAIDATCKSDGTALSDHTTEELISRRWHEYGFEKP